MTLTSTIWTTLNHQAVRRTSVGRFCQICGIEDVPRRALKEGPRPEWALFCIEFEGEGFLQIITCPDCQKVHSEQVLKKYKHRIRSGGDVKYH